jgi:acyl-CoA reductase-like NAD-dependent aldehyde dehydrogenase
VRASAWSTRSSSAPRSRSSRFRDLDEAVAQANATHYGLGGSVWTADPSRGEAVAERLECGTAWVNQHLQVTPKLPFGG